MVIMRVVVMIILLMEAVMAGRKIVRVMVNIKL